MRHLGDVANGDTRVAKRRGGPAGRDELPVERAQASRELEQAGFVGDGEQRTWHRTTRVVEGTRTRRRATNPRRGRRRLTTHVRAPRRRARPDTTRAPPRARDRRVAPRCRRETPGRATVR